MSWAIKERDYSQRRACALIGLAPKVYRHRRRSDDGVLRTRLRSLAGQRRGNSGSHARCHIPAFWNQNLHGSSGLNCGIALPGI